jgi:purine-binding chemotaxis protein CheW
MSNTTATNAEIVDHIMPLEFLLFTLHTEEYGIDIQKVQEIRGYDMVTRIANSPDYIKGVVNLRGVIVPIIDLRVKFNLGTPTYDEFTVVIILNLKGRITGMVVDSVSDVTTLSPEQLRPVPETTAGGESDYMIGIGVVDERMLILIDIERLLRADEIDRIEHLAA